MPLVDLDTLNTLPAAGFVRALDGIYEHSPWVAAATAAARPFAHRFALADALNASLRAAPREQRIALVRAHPELAGRAAVRGELTAESTREQAGAGLAHCTPGEFARLQELNARYNARFGFPFVLSVKGHDRASIIAAFERRLHHDPETELATAIEQIARIAEFRLAERVGEPAGRTILAMAERLAQYSDQEGALTCTFFSPAHRATATLLREWMLQAGLDAQIDAIGNVVGRWPGTPSGAGTLITGSHYDTVINGGRYDGRLGILLPIVVVQRLRQQGRTLPFDLEIVGFSEEEGVRFKSTFLGSSAIAGRFDPANLDRRDAQDQRLGDVLVAAGHDPAAIAALARPPGSVSGYVEVHIEQGPVLLDEQRAVGVVTAINGSLRYLVEIIGLAGHSGTVPMTQRRDAAAAAAEIVLYVERRCAAVPALVGTVGRLQVPDGAINVIPGRCELSIDLRSPRDDDRDAAAADIFAEIAAIAARRNVQVRSQRVLEVAATPCAPRLQRQLAASITRVTGDAAPRELPSGAGHDALQLAALTEVAMLFVRCGAGGISHHPAETLSRDDADTAAAVFADFLEHYAG